MRYDLHVSLKPEYHEGYLKHFWKITQTNEQGEFIIKNGYAPDTFSAIVDASEAIAKLNL